MGERHETGAAAGGLRLAGTEKQSRPGLPLISVVTVVFNGERHLEQAIASVAGQSYGNVEYIIVDGGSRDATLDIIRRHEGSIDYWLSEPDQGIYDAMNKGIALARGELIGLLNADDFYEPDALAQVAEAYRQGPCQGVYYGNNFVLQEDLGLRYRSYPSLRYWLGMPICHQAMFVHAEVYRRLQGYSLAYRFAADYHFLLRTLREEVPYRHVDAFLVNYRNTGLTSDFYTVSLSEARRINRAFCGPLSAKHAQFLASFAKTLLLHHLQRGIGALFGVKTLDRARLWYMRTFIIKDRQDAGSP